MSDDPFEMARRQLEEAQRAFRRDMERARSEFEAAMQRARTELENAAAAMRVSMETARGHFQGFDLPKRRRRPRRPPRIGGGVPVEPNKPRGLSGGAAAELDFED